MTSQEKQCRTSAEKKSNRPRIKSQLSEAADGLSVKTSTSNIRFRLVTSTMIAFSPSSSTTDQPVARSTYAQDYRSPSCVYLG